MKDCIRPSVVIFLPSLAGGGAENVFSQLAISLHQQGVYVELWLAKQTGPYMSALPSDLPVMELGGRGVLFGIPCLILRLISRRPRSLLSAMTHANIAALLAVALVRLCVNPPPRVVVSERCALTMIDAPSRYLRLKEASLRLLIPFIYPLADSIACVSEGVLQGLRSRLGRSAGKLRCIPNPVDLELWRRRAAEPLLHPWLGDDQIPLVVSAGRLVLLKDFATLLRAIQLVRLTRRVRLVILGEGAERIRLDRQSRELGICDDLLMPGFVSNPMAWMARCSVFVLSSRSEGLPNVLLQAMACGAPVVSTDCPHGPSEILEDGRWGTLVPVADAPSLAEAILEKLSASSAASILANDGTVVLREPSPRCFNYETSRIVSSYLDLLDDSCQ